MLLPPFCRADQSLFFRIPTAEDNRALRLPPRLQQFTNAVCCLKHGSRTAIGIDGSIHPGIAMISADDPFVRKFVAADFADYVPNCAVLIILLKVHLHFRRTRTDVISERQRPLPIACRIRASQMLQDGPRIGIGNWRCGNPWQLRRLLRWHTLGIW